MSTISKKQYKKQLRDLQVELVKLQRQLIEDGGRVLAIFEGRDGAGKDGTIKRITQHLSPRETRTVALGKPSDREQSQWYFQRYVEHLPAAGEIVLFNRSWYNRAGVERVMGFCAQEEYERFMETVPEFERMLVRSGIRMFKFYLDISRAEQARRLDDRRTNPLKQWKISPIDEAALRYWDEYTAARDAMLSRTHHPWAPWVVVRADEERSARLNVIRHILERMEYEDKDSSLVAPDLDVVFQYDAAHLRSGAIVR
ncbi:MAG: polyphosphate kinase 2 [Chloroflexota bacterium]